MSPSDRTSGDEALGWPAEPAEPERRLAVNVDVARRRLRQWRPRTTFPWTTPPWPAAVERPALPRQLGVDYQTGWARRYGVRLARVVVSEGLTWPLTRLVASPTVGGLDRIAHLHQPVIFAANHASHLDTPLLLSVLPERWRHRTAVAGGADYFFDKRWKAAFFAFGINAIPIERHRVSRRSVDLAAQLLEEGWSLLIYPEGGRSPDGWGQVHRPGAAWLAQRTGRTIVPIHVEGTQRILPRRGGRLRPGRTRIAFGHPLRPVPGGDARELAAEIERAVAVLADEQMSDWWTARRRAASGATPTLIGPSAAAWRRTWLLDRSGGRHRRRAGRDDRHWPWR